MDKSSLDLLAEQLPPLAFDGKADTEFAQSPLAQEYLNYYGINFTPLFDGLRHGFGCVDSAEFKVAVQYWLPAEIDHSTASYEEAAEGFCVNATGATRGTLFLVHGYCDHVGLYGPFIQRALQEQYAVVVFDLPGHGLSSGAEATIDSFSDYSRALEKVIALSAGLVPSPRLITGQSTGAAVALDHFWRCREQNIEFSFDKMVLLAPLVRSRGWSYLGWSLPLLQLLKTSLKRNFSINSHDHEFLKFISTKDAFQTQLMPLAWIAAMKQWIARVQSQPTSSARLLVLQGDEDQTVDWRFNVAKLREKFPEHMQLEMLPGSFHHLLRESPEYRDVVFKRMFEYLQS